MLRAIVERGRTDLEAVAVNDLAPVETSTYLVDIDNVYGRFPAPVTVQGGTPKRFDLNPRQGQVETPRNM